MFFSGDKYDRNEETKPMDKNIAMSLGVSAASAVIAAVASANDPTVAIGLGVVAAGGVLNAAWLKYKTQIVDKIEDVVEDVTGVDVELDGAVDKLVDEAKDIAEDLIDDGELNNSTGEVDVPLSVDEAKEDIADAIEHTKETLSDMTVNDIKALLKEKNLKVSGTKLELINRLLGDEE